MGEIKVTRWECDVCARKFDTNKEYHECMAGHDAEEAIVSVEKTVTIGIPRGGQSMMGGPITFEGYDWTEGKIVAKRNTRNGPEALVEIDQAREWVSGFQLIEWEKTKRNEDYLRQHPIDYSTMSHTCVVCGGNK